MVDTTVTPPPDPTIVPPPPPVDEPLPVPVEVGEGVGEGVVGVPPAPPMFRTPIALFPWSVNQILPSGPTVIPAVFAPVGRLYIVNWPVVGFSSPIWASFPVSLNQRLPDESTVIELGEGLFPGTLNCPMEAPELEISPM